MIPFLIGAWVLRVRTTVTPDGLELRRAFSSQSISWDQVKGFRFPQRGWARAARLVDGTEVSLPTVTFGRLPQLASASGGGHRPYAAARAAEARKRAAEAEAARSDETAATDAPGRNAE